MAAEQDILHLPPPKRPPRLTSRRIGIHASIAGGVANAAERAYRLGCNTFQIFSTSPRQWQPYELSRTSIPLTWDLCRRNLPCPTVSPREPVRFPLLFGRTNQVFPARATREVWHHFLGSPASMTRFCRAMLL